MSAKSKGTSQELGFGAAMEELEAILGRVESDEIDIDELAEELKGRPSSLRSAAKRFARRSWK